MKGQDSDASKSKRKDSVAQMKSLLLSKVLSRIIMVMVQAWPLYALHTDTDTLLQILRWSKKIFNRAQGKADKTAFSS